MIERQKVNAKRTAFSPLGAPRRSIRTSDRSQGTNHTVRVARQWRHLTTVWTRAVRAAGGWGFLAVLAAMGLDLADGQDSLAAFRAMHLKLRYFSGHGNVREEVS